MKATVTIKDLSDQFWNGFGELIPAFLSQSPIDQFQRLEKLSHEMPKNVSLKIGNGAFKDRIDWSREIASSPQNLTSKVEPRRGYKLVTFELDRKNPARRSDESPLYVKYLSLKSDEEPFMMQGTKYQYVWAEYPGGIKDIGVYSYANDLVYSYDSFRQMMNLDRAATNPKGVYTTYSAWRAAAKKNGAVRFEGGRNDIAQAWDAAGSWVGEWDGAEGFISKPKSKENPVRPRKGEPSRAFVSRCMSEEKASFPEPKQRIAVCLSKSRKRNPVYDTGSDE